jgi:hypothetical protein
MFLRIVAVASILLIGADCPKLSASEFDDLKDAAAKQIDDGSVVAKKPAITVSGQNLIIDTGDVHVVGIGKGNAMTFRPMQNQLSVLLLQKYAFHTDPDKSVIAPYFAKIEAHIHSEIDILSQANNNPEGVKDKLDAEETQIAQLLSDGFKAVAQARGLSRALVTKAAHPGWKVAVHLPAGATLRYTPFLNYLLYKQFPDLIDWLDANDGDTVELRGRYRIELLQHGSPSTKQDRDFTSDSSIQFD